MYIDDTSFKDISIFHAEEDQSIFDKLNFTRTEGGKAWLKHFFKNPFDNIQKITGTQEILKMLLPRIEDWPKDITNGTMMVMNKFLEYGFGGPGEHPTTLDALVYRIFNAGEYSLTRFSVKHFFSFFGGLQKILQIVGGLDLPEPLKTDIHRLGGLLEISVFRRMATEDPKKPSIQKNLFFAAHLRGRHKSRVQELMEIYYRLDAWYSMAAAVKKFDLCFPEFVDQEMAMVSAKGLYHLLLQNPVPYHLNMGLQHNFLFLTGANMAGKSTLIKSVGSSVFLAHLGMGVPAREMKLTLFHGLISNINVVDNIVKGESLFFNEVQRIKTTVQKSSDGNKWLVLIDELFKGTNIEDAMKCSLAVIRGLVKIKNSLFILSTHLYEIGHDLKDEEKITFRHFETTVNGENLHFSYQLKEGISEDRLGYFILKREKVVDLLKNL